MAASVILKKALKASNEMRYSVGNVSTDNGLVEGTEAYNSFWDDDTAYSELAWVESTFREGGHINCDERAPGMNLEHARLKKLLKEFHTPARAAAFKKAYPSAA